MARKKEHCPECCIWTLAIDPPNCDAIHCEQERLRRLKIPKGKRTFEKVANKIFAEWRIWSDTQQK